MSAGKRRSLVHGGGDNQLFCGRTFNDFVLLCEFSYFGSACVFYHISCVSLLQGLKGKITYVRLSEANYNINEFSAGIPVISNAQILSLLLLHVLACSNYTQIVIG